MKLAVDSLEVTKNQLYGWRIWQMCLSVDTLWPGQRRSDHRETVMMTLACRACETTRTFCSHMCHLPFNLCIMSRGALR